MVLEAKCLSAWIAWNTEVQMGQAQRRERANRVTESTTNQTQNNQSNQQQTLPPVQESSDGYQSESTLDSTNNINEVSQIYLESLQSSSLHNPPNIPVIKHYAKRTLQEINDIQHDKSTTLIPDSGATNHFSGEESHFEYLLPLPSTENNQLFLGDDSTAYKILGVGPLNILMNGKRARILAYYVPAIKTTLLSITKHIEYDGCYFHAENNTYTLAFPRDILHPTIQSEAIIHIQSAKHLPSTTPYIFDYMQDSLCQAVNNEIASVIEYWMITE